MNSVQVILYMTHIERACLQSISQCPMQMHFIQTNSFPEKIRLKRMLFCMLVAFNAVENVSHGVIGRVDCMFSHSHHLTESSLFKFEAILGLKDKPVSTQLCEHEMIILAALIANVGLAPGIEHLINLR